MGTCKFFWRVRRVHACIPRCGWERDMFGECADYFYEATE
jgi:hypothetical protein